MPNPLAVGQAAATAAPLAATGHAGDVRRVPVAALRRRLLDDGACLA
jgi:hypothetical protein